MVLNLTLANVATAIGECAVIAGVLVPVVVRMKKLTNGTRCQLRNDILAIYYRYKKDKCIPQFEYENFTALCNAYEALNGNSFVKKIRNDVEQKWEISSEEDDE